MLPSLAANRRLPGPPYVIDDDLVDYVNSFAHGIQARVRYDCLGDFVDDASGAAGERVLLEFVFTGRWIARQTEPT